MNAKGSITVSSIINDNPAIQSQSSAEDDKEATKKPSTQYGLSFAVSVGLYRDDAYAYIAGNSTVNAGDSLTVNAESLNRINPNNLEVWNLVAPFLSGNNNATWNTGDTGAEPLVSPGDTVDVLHWRFTAAHGDVGDRYGVFRQRRVGRPAYMDP